MECTKFFTLHAHIPSSHEPRCFSLLPRCRRRCRLVVPTYSLFSKTKTTSIPHPEPPTPSSPPPLNSQSSSQPSHSFPFSSLPNHACQPFAIMLFSIALSFIPNPLSNLHAIAVPAMVTSQIVTRSKKEDASNDHEFSVYTKRLLKVVPILQERIREVREEKGDMGLVKEALKGVREKRKEIQKEIMGSLMKEFWRLGDEKAEYLKKSKAVLGEALPVREELSKLVRREKARSGGNEGEVAVKDREKIVELERRLEELERDFNVLTEKAEELDQRIERRERFTFSVGIREILFVERECEELVEKLNQWLEQKEMERYNCNVVPHWSVW